MHFNPTKKLTVALLLALASTSTVFAREGGKAGNGGNAVVCRQDGKANGKIVKARLLDFNEMKRGKLKLSPLVETLKRDEKSKNTYIARLAKLDASLAERTNEIMVLLGKAADERKNAPRADGVYGKVEFTPESLGEVPDSEHLTYEEGCKVEQTVIRTNAITRKLYRTEAEFIIQETIFDALPPAHQLGLFAHEGIYTYRFDEAKDETSQIARALNRYVASTEFDAANYWERILGGQDIVSVSPHPLKVRIGAEKAEVLSIQRISGTNFYLVNLDYSKEGALSESVFNADGSWNPLEAAARAVSTALTLHAKSPTIPLPLPKGGYSMVVRMDQSKTVKERFVRVAGEPLMSSILLHQGYMNGPRKEPNALTAEFKVGVMGYDWKKFKKTYQWSELEMYLEVIRPGETRGSVKIPVMTVKLDGREMPGDSTFTYTLDFQKIHDENINKPLEYR